MTSLVPNTMMQETYNCCIWECCGWANGLPNSTPKILERSFLKLESTNITRSYVKFSHITCLTWSFRAMWQFFLVSFNSTIWSSSNAPSFFTIETLGNWCPFQSSPIIWLQMVRSMSTNWNLLWYILSMMMKVLWLQVINVLGLICVLVLVVF